MPAVDEDLALIRTAAVEAGRIAMRYFGKKPEVWLKDGQSPVSEADYAADKYLRETLTAARPEYGWLSEETADSAARLKARRTFIVDPIDGTRGFLDGRKTWGVSVAIVEDGRSLVGALDCPAAGEHFWAARGQGAWMNDRKISVRRDATRYEIGGPEKFYDRLPEELRARCRHAGYIPSLAYRLALIASGRLDGTFVKPNARDWDLAAAALLLEEAGGQLVNRQGGVPAYGAEITSHGALAAGSGELLAQMSAVIMSHSG